MKYDAIIVGAGAAGLFAAFELTDLNICVIDKGKPVDKRRSPADIMCGVGGSGTFSDGKLHYSPVLSHEKILHLYSVQEYEKLLNKVDKIFTKFGVNSDFYPKDIQKVQELVDNAKIHGIQLYIRKIKHVGSNKLPAVINNFEKHLRSKGVTFKTECEVVDIIVEDNNCKGVILSDGTKLKADKILLAPGRIGATWLQKLAKKNKPHYQYEKIEIGVRVEFPASVMAKHAKLMYEAIFALHTPTFDGLVRTFCPCPEGMVAIEEYDGFICVNGHSYSGGKTGNSNFALVTEIKLTEPLENTTKYGKCIAQLATTLGGNKPIIQRLADLKRGRRSTWDRINKSYVKPTLLDVSPGDIAMALPYRIVTNILEGIEALDKVMPGLNTGDTLLYAPEVKFRSSKIKTSKYLETEIKNLFVAGDAAGVSGNIVGAAATGIIAANGIKK